LALLLLRRRRRSAAPDVTQGHEGHATAAQACGHNASCVAVDEADAVVGRAIAVDVEGDGAGLLVLLAAEAHPPPKDAIVDAVRLHSTYTRFEMRMRRGDSSAGFGGAA